MQRKRWKKEKKLESPLLLEEQAPEASGRASLLQVPCLSPVLSLPPE